MIARFARSSRAWTVVAAVARAGARPRRADRRRPASPRASPRRTPADRREAGDAAARGSPGAERRGRDAEPTDYVIGANDLVDVTVFDLEGPAADGQAVRVSGSGSIALPYLKEPIRLSGLTEIDAQRAIAHGVRRAGVSTDANVSVRLPKPATSPSRSRRSPPTSWSPCRSWTSPAPAWKR